jgi:hypothetical protein
VRQAAEPLHRIIRPGVTAESGFKTLQHYAAAAERSYYYRVLKELRANRKLEAPAAPANSQPGGESPRQEAPENNSGDHPHGLTVHPPILHDETKPPMSGTVHPRP